MSGDGKLAGRTDEEDPNVRLLLESAAQLADSAQRLQRVSDLLPTDEDFHYYTNFVEFCEPIKRVESRVLQLFSRISSLRCIPRAPALPSDTDDLSDWLVDIQDEVLEQIDSAFDLYKTERASQGLPPPENDAFMYQNTRRKRRRAIAMKDIKAVLPDGGVVSMQAEKCPIPFHVWSIPRPQDKFDVPVDNSNTPFRHPRRILGSSCNIESDIPVHPLQEGLQNMNFEGILDTYAEPKRPVSIEATPFTFVNTPSLLEETAAKLASEREIAVDLEHHQFRSFQGLTCLMQISTRSEDFIIDTLELRSIIGKHLFNVFASPAIQKVMHGAGLDVLWLQRDFGIYVCNLFDTGQAARVLELESFGLSHLLKCFCDVTPDKRYQMADWRLRPLTVEMIKYAREDTHYLLYIRDLLQEKLVASQAEDKQELLVEVLRRSRDICLRLYEKEITTETSFLQVYGLEDRKFNTQQLSVLSALYSWRDQTARVEDESTGYVLPNHLLLKLAEEMPDDVKALRTILNGRHKVVARNSATIVNIISKAKLLPQTPEAKSQSKLESAKQKSSLVFEEVPFAEDATSQACENNQDSAAKPAQESFNFDGVLNSSIGECSSNLPVTGVENGGKDVHITTNIVFQKTTKSALFGNQKGRTKNKEIIEHLTKSIGNDPISKEPIPDCRNIEDTPSTAVVKRAIGSSFLLKSKKNNKVGKMLQNIAMEVEIPPYGTTRNGNQQAVNAEGEELEDLVYMLDNRASLQVEATTNLFFKEDIMQAEAKARAEKIRASFSLPFHSFHGGQIITEEQSAVALKQDYNEKVPQGLESQEIEDISPLKDDLVTSSVERGTDEQGHMISKGVWISPDGVQCRLWWPDRLGTAAVLSSVKSDNDPQDVADSDSSQTEYPVPLSQKFSQQKERSKMNTQLSLPNTYNASGIKQEGQSATESVTPFDYAAAKKNMDFFRSPFETKQGEGSNLAGWNERRESSQRIFNPRTQMKEFKPEGITPGKRRQVFPQSGSRTGVFK